MKNDLLIIGALAVGGYFLLKEGSDLKQKLDATVSSITQPINDAKVFAYNAQNDANVITQRVSSEAQLLSTRINAGVVYDPFAKLWVLPQYWGRVDEYGRLKWGF